MPEKEIKKTIEIKIDSITINGSLIIPENATGLVLFAHGSGSSRFSPRNNYVAQILNKEKLATLLVDLLTREEDSIYENRFNIELLADRLIKITNKIQENEETKNLNIGLFGASTGAAAAIKAAAKEKDFFSAIVSRGGRVDLANKELPEIETPILLIVGEKDDIIIDINKYALSKINSSSELSIIPGATHLFEEAGALDKVAEQASSWFVKYLKGE